MSFGVQLEPNNRRIELQSAKIKDIHLVNRTLLCVGLHVVFKNKCLSLYPIHDHCDSMLWSSKWSTFGYWFFYSLRANRHRFVREVLSGFYIKVVIFVPSEICSLSILRISSRVLKIFSYLIIWDRDALLCL